MTVTPSRDDAGPRVEELCRIADQTAAALATGQRVAGPAAPEEGISQLLVTPEVRGVWADLADGSVAAIFATADAVSPGAFAGDPAALVAELGDALTAGAAGAGGLTSPIQPLLGLEQIPGRLSQARAGDELVGAGIFDGDTVVAAVGVSGALGAGPDTGFRTGPPEAEARPASPVRDAQPRNFNLLADVELGVSAELGRTSMSMGELLDLQPGAVIDLDRPVGTPIDVLVNGTLIARGEVVVVDDSYAVRVTEVVAEGDER